jgi:hypothetical protein
MHQVPPSQRWVGFFIGEIMLSLKTKESPIGTPFKNFTLSQESLAVLEQQIINDIAQTKMGGAAWLISVDLKVSVSIELSQAYEAMKEE